MNPGRVIFALPDPSDKKVLDMGSSSGHSPKWCGNRGANELWGHDISD